MSSGIGITQHDKFEDRPCRWVCRAFWYQLVDRPLDDVGRQQYNQLALDGPCLLDGQWL
jgi:hypothetical protein